MKVGLTRDAVVAAAADLADEDGLRALTVSSVARRVGVRTPSLYSHVAGTDALHAGVSTLALDELADLVDRAIAGLAGRDALVALADTHRAYALAHPGRYEAAGVVDRELTPDLVRAAERHSAQALAVLRGYAVPEAERVHAVRLLASLLRGFVQLEAGGAFAHSDPPSQQTWTRALDVLDEHLAGLGR
ncbi:TetR-like C-terminal domain-containing protein [Nocardioides plantarum]|uniref:TetR-like C-terminal domain-containing protein n=1 Tax=Nocardioides plantarum TaxID=29299 RepID=A0ABV5KFB5_9ACTN|nr:TetR-like C-terminal domain-containing protein [Nocardioides plantarum]